MTPDHPLWTSFLEQLEGPEGCDFRDDEAGNLTWTCDGSIERPLTCAILQSIPDIDVTASLEYFNAHGSFCDCEIVFNVDPPEYEPDQTQKPPDNPTSD
jgi:hypothetical protein